jgi:hypothetical protein
LLISELGVMDQSLNPCGLALRNDAEDETRSRWAELEVLPHWTAMVERCVKIIGKMGTLHAWFSWHDGGGGK